MQYNITCIVYQFFRTSPRFNYVSLPGPKLSMINKNLGININHTLIKCTNLVKEGRKDDAAIEDLVLMDTQQN